MVETADKIFVVMELVQGGELFEYLLDRGPLSEAAAVHIMRQVRLTLNRVDGLVGTTTVNREDAYRSVPSRPTHTHNLSTHTHARAHR